MKITIYSALYFLLVFFTLSAGIAWFLYNENEIINQLMMAGNLLFSIGVTWLFNKYVFQGLFGYYFTLKGSALLGFSVASIIKLFVSQEFSFPYLGLIVLVIITIKDEHKEILK